MPSDFSQRTEQVDTVNMKNSGLCKQTGDIGNKEKKRKRIELSCLFGKEEDVRGRDACL